MSFSKAMEKFKGAKNKAVQKLPKPLRQKADDKLGLFLHKYIATLFYFDDEIQEIYWEMEEAVQEGDREKASQLSTEMKYIITMKSDENKGTSTRKHRQAVSKATDKIQKVTELLKDKSKAGTVKAFLKLDKDKDLDEIELDQEMEDLVEEVEE